MRTSGNRFQYVDFRTGKKTWGTLTPPTRAAEMPRVVDPEFNRGVSPGFLQRGEPKPLSRYESSFEAAAKPAEDAPTRRRPNKHGTDD